MRHTRALLATSAVLAVLLTGCAGGTAEPTAGPTGSESPSIPSLTPTDDGKGDDQVGIPVGDALTAWADSALPVDSPGGTAPLLRETATLGPEADEVTKEVDLAAGSWTLGIACIGDGTVSSDIDLDGQDYQNSDALPCAKAPDYQPVPLKVEIDGPVRVTWEIEADQPAGVVYEIVSGSSTEQ